jgi:hypothetical protein
MTGNQVPEIEIEYVRNFLRLTQKQMPDKFSITKEQFVRMLAWYGAVRANRPGIEANLYVKTETA